MFSPMVSSSCSTSFSFPSASSALSVALLPSCSHQWSQVLVQHLSVFLQRAQLFQLLFCLHVLTNGLKFLFNIFQFSFSELSSFSCSFAFIFSPMVSSSCSTSFSFPSASSALSVALLLSSS